MAEPQALAAQYRALTARYSALTVEYGLAVQRAQLYEEAFRAAIRGDTGDPVLPCTHCMTLHRSYLGERAGSDPRTCRKCGLTKCVAAFEEFFVDSLGVAREDGADIVREFCTACHDVAASICMNCTVRECGLPEGAFRHCGECDELSCAHVFADSHRDCLQ